MTSSPEKEEPARDVRDRFPALYSELREVAARLLGREPASVTPSDLVHETFLKLRQEEARRERDGRSELGEKPDSALKACFGAACRDVLVDRVRKRTAAKRGGGMAPEQLNSTIAMPDRDEEIDVMTVHDAISALADFDPQLAQLVEARVFGKMSVPECAELFGMSARTVDRRWAFAVAWLREKLE